MQPNIRQLMRRVRHIEISTRRAANDTLAGRFQSVFRGRGMDFDERQVGREPLALIISYPNPMPPTMPDPRR